MHSHQLKNMSLTDHIRNNIDSHILIELPREHALCYDKNRCPIKTLFKVLSQKQPQITSIHNQTTSHKHKEPLGR